MKKTEKIIGLPVIDLSTGNQVGKVWDIIINGEKGAADYFIIDDGSMILGAKVVAAKDIQGIGEYALTVKRKDVIREMSKTEQAVDLYKKNVKVKGTRVLTQKGRLVGGILDIYLNEEDCLISALEFKAFSGPQNVKIIPRREVITFGENLIVVVENLEEMLQDNYEDDENDILGSNEADAAEGLSTAYPEKLSDKYQENMSYVDESTVRSAVEEDLMAAPHKRTAVEEKKTEKSNIKIEKTEVSEVPEVPEMLVQESMPQEEPVTEEEKAAEICKPSTEPQAEPEKPVKVSIDEKPVPEEKEQEEEDVFREGISAASYSQKPPAAVSHKPENRHRPQAERAEPGKSSNLFEQKQKEFLLGRRITKTIKDAKGNQILAQGDIINEEAINRAKDAGKLIEIVMNNKA